MCVLVRVRLCVSVCVFVCDLGHSFNTGKRLAVNTLAICCIKVILRCVDDIIQKIQFFYFFNVRKQREILKLNQRKTSVLKIRIGIII